MLEAAINPRCGMGDVIYMGQKSGRPKGGVLTAADFRSQSNDWADRRKEPRIPCEREVSILPAGAADGEGFRAAGLFDVSARGIGIVSRHPMDVGDQFLVKLRFDRRALATYTVRHCTRAADGRYYKIGAELTSFVGATGKDPLAALDAILGGAV